MTAPIRVCLVTSKHSIRDSRVFGGFFSGIERAGGEATIIGPSPEEHEEDPRSIRLPVRASANEDTLSSPRLMLERRHPEGLHVPGKQAIANALIASFVDAA